MYEMPVCQFPEEAGVSSKGVLTFVKKALESKMGYHSVLVMRHGKIAATVNFGPYDEKTPHVMYSLSKTFCSAACGFAVAEGLLSWDSKVVDVLPECAPENPSEDLKKITLSHLLCMGSGLHPDSDAFGADGEDWGKRTLSYPVIHEPGTVFHYNSHGTYLASRMVQKVAGVNIRDYLMPRMFEKLGIEKPDWDVCPQGVCCGGWGLHLASRDVAKFGQMLLQNGVWNGEQVLPEGWVENASSIHIDNYNHDEGEPSDWNQGYGYQIWRCRYGRFRGDGMFGQYCVVDREKDMVVVCNAGCNDIAKELNWIHEYLFDAADMEEGTEEEKQELQSLLRDLAYPVPQGKGERAVNGLLTFRYEEGEINLAFAQQDADSDIVLTTEIIALPGETAKLDIVFGQGEFRTSRWGKTPFAPNGMEVMGAYGWQDGKLCMVARTKEGPYSMDNVLRFEEDGVYVDGCSVGIPFVGENLKLEGSI